MHNHAHELTLGLSFLLGALHALEPGHGKTAMLVYLTGGRRSFWHPVVMGLTTAASHSVSLIVIAFGVHLTHHLVAGDHHHEQHVSGVLQWVSALLVIAVGGFMLTQARRGKRHRCCGHHHAESDSHASCSDQQLVSLQTPASANPAALQPVAPAVRGSYRTTALLGLAVGLLPCPSALAAYFTGLSSGSPTMAYVIVGLFAAGIACSLTVVGILLQQFGDRLGRRSQSVSRVPWAYVRAGLILVIGLFYTLRLAVA